MTADSLETFKSLSPAEREALDGVLKFQSSKEIARRIGKSAKTVDQRLDRARIKLGAANRFAAAHRYGQLRATWERLLCEPSPISDDAFLASNPSGVAEDAVYTLGDAIPFAADTGWPAAPRRDAPKVWEQDLGTLSRIGLMLAGTFIVLVLALLGVGVAEGLKDLIRGG